MLSLLLNIPIVGPVLLVVILLAVLAWSGLIGGGGGAPSAEEVRAAEQARCAALLDAFERKERAGLPAERPQGC